MKPLPFYLLALTIANITVSLEVQSSDKEQKAQIEERSPKGDNDDTSRLWIDFETAGELAPEIWGDGALSPSELR